jgi:hypothetical protein
MNHPWEEINLTDYEKHMKLDSVMQLQVMNDVMKAQLSDYPLQTVMILGVAGGNGLEHVTSDKIKRVYGVDINKAYLAECIRRYPALEGVLECVCADLMDERVFLPHADLVMANLVIEYIGYDCFLNVIRQVAPSIVSCLIQINTDEGFVSDSPYLHVFDCLESVHRQMHPEPLAEAMQRIGYTQASSTEHLLPNGKKFLRSDFILAKST